MKKLDSRIDRKFYKDIDWSTRFLSIYNIKEQHAYNLILDIITDLSNIKWTKETESLRQKIFMDRLRQAIETYKTKSTIAA